MTPFRQADRRKNAIGKQFTDVQGEDPCAVGGDGAKVKNGDTIPIRRR